MGDIEPIGAARDDRAPLAFLQGARPSAPAWFEQAIAIAPERSLVQIHGSGIEVLVWGERGRPGVVLMHGNAAHADIWRHVAPLLAQDRRVVAFSWPGMGRSEWRDSYSHTDFAADIFALCDHIGLFDGGARPALIAHSMAGGAAVIAASKEGARFSGLAIVDSGLRDPASYAGKMQVPRPHKVYADMPTALAHFRFAPQQPVGNMFVADMIARASLRQVDGGWTWLFDPKLWRRLPLAPVWPYVATVACPLAFVTGEHSSVTRSLIDMQKAQAPAGTRFVTIPDGHHHLMVDQPLALVAVLRTMLAFWQ